ncbi:hypothetical protein BKA67DRAFT_657739 [Truncatella angustata]|uniref:Uncharacterized protein n=1 Tax=Truncatella angustata TaxID=152316 RepID=A0A9P8UP29_9PEZI|nr:uncharacterized protein BKA67DRAFT_657739 [Truncatella angustata]KAH6655831.1 hypothetical protein BKA67DRAFT_657739 [Truncatella angustata]
MNSQLLNASRRAMLRAQPRFASTVSRRYASGHAPTDYGRIAKRAGSVAVVYFPLAALVLGWPLAAHKVVDYFGV